MSMFSPSRDQARNLFFETWRKYREAVPLTALEDQVLSVILLHPEYHGLLEDPQGERERDYGPEAGRTNPFLHLSLHLALSEQQSIDQPPGIRAHLAALAARHGQHQGLHRALECLGQTLWQAQRSASPPDQEAYLACLEQARG